MPSVSDVRPLDVLLLRRDVLVARYQSVTARWQAVQGAAMAAAGVGLVAWVGGALGTSSLGVLGAVAAGFVAVGGLALSRIDRWFERAMRGLVAEAERLMGEAHP